MQNMQQGIEEIKVWKPFRKALYRTEGSANNSTGDHEFSRATNREVKGVVIAK
jgi:hypothetical protein